MPRFAYGGQALMEGILMRGRDAVAVAVRDPGGDILTASEPLDSLLHRSRFARAPLFRGVVLLYETLVIGTRWLMRSGAVQAAGEGIELGRSAIAGTLIFTLVLVVGLFVLAPLFLAQAATSSLLGIHDQLIQHLVEGLIRIAVFVVYLLVLSLQPDVRRVFRYHGAEHMTIHALEHDEALTIDNIRRHPTAHPRCGTEFLVVFVIVSILVFSLLAGQSLLVSVVGRVLLIPVVAAISYELLRFGARYRGNVLVRWIFMPGIWLQLITTKQPDDGMIEIAVASMQRALAVSGETAPEGSLDPANRPMFEVAGTEPAAGPAGGA
jgi:uncharacterized protein YqhQ